MAGAAPPIPDFDPGVPLSGPDHSRALGALLGAGTGYLARFDDTRFFAPQGTAWSPAIHVRHLRKTTQPFTLALGLPRWPLALCFGRGSGVSRSYEAIRETYRATLAGGLQAGLFTPRPEATPVVPALRRQEIMAGWAAATVAVQHALTRWSEAALDRYRLPHPVLGSLTVQEMASFTVYHTSHHLRRIAERAGG
ncbi:MAG TPA: DinB family protein [Gemmatimonadales bacterium]|nr:DinB family protein [Gemmatimonadales bacterium]